MISKILQNLGNGVQFGKKEEFMTPLNDLIDYYLPLIQDFFDRLAVRSPLPLFWRVQRTDTEQDIPLNESVSTPPIPVDNDLLEKFHTATVYGKDRILETISAYETAYSLPVGSERNLFVQVLNFLEASDPVSI